jgi:hypothetical protein
MDHIATKKSQMSQVVKMLSIHMKLYEKMCDFLFVTKCHGVT